MTDTIQAQLPQPWARPSVSSFAPLLAFAGAALFVFAHALSHFIYGYLGHAREVNIAVWALVCGGIVLVYVEPRRSICVTQQIALTLALFSIGFFSPYTDYLDFTAGTISILGVIMLTVGLILWKDAHATLARLWKLIDKQRRIPPAVFSVCGYVLFLIFTLAVSWQCFTFVPGYDDATAQYVQGKFIAEGRLYGPSPAMKQFFPVAMMVNDGKWYAQYQPLHVFLEGFGHFIGAPWIINPLNGACTLFLIYLISRRVFGEGTARAAVLLTLICSFMLIMSAEFMNHATALTFTTLLIYGYMETLESTEQRRRNLWAIITGLAAGAVFLTRPLTAVGVALPFAIHGIILLRRDFRYYLKPFALMALAGMLCVVFDLWYNKQLTDAYMIFPTGKYHGSDNIHAMGYSKEPFSLSYTLSKAEHELARFNRQLFEWWLPATFFLMLFFMLPVRNLYARLMMGVIISHIVVNFGNQFNSMVFGPRYIYELCSVVIILSAAGITRIPLLLRTIGIRLRGRAVSNGIVACVMLMIVSYAIIVRAPAIIQLYSHNFFDHHPDFYDAMMARAEKPALVFIGRGGNTQNKYRWVRFTNPPDDASPVIFAVDQGNQKDKDLAQRYMDRHVYVEYQNRLINLENILAGNTVITIPDMPPAPPPAPKK